ncbi:MAG: BLUF domain-containing protein [Planctomycetota bacterium]
MLSQLVYTSRPSDGVTIRDAQEILDAARSFNPSKNITGLLVFRHNLFLQYLEGERRDLTDLFTKISADPRHKDVELIGSRPSETRLFPDWSMAFVALGAENRAVMLRETGAEKIDTGELTMDEAVRLMRGLSGAELTSVG